MTFLRLSIFLRFLSNFIPQKLTFSYTHPFLLQKGKPKKFFQKIFQILFTLLKNNFQFYFFCFINESPKKFFQKIFKNSQTPYIMMRGQKLQEKIENYIPPNIYIM